MSNENIASLFALSTVARTTALFKSFERRYTRRAAKQYSTLNKSRENARRADCQKASIPCKKWVMDCSVLGDGSRPCESKSRRSLAKTYFHTKLHRAIFQV